MAHIRAHLELGDIVVVEGSHRWGRLIAMRAATNQYDIRDLETNETITLKRYDFKRKRVCSK